MKKFGWIAAVALVCSLVFAGNVVAGPTLERIQFVASYLQEMSLQARPWNVFNSVVNWSLEPRGHSLR
ncbi:MAG: hypothetical protein JRJ51_09175 [Deltaproteobacteria bacterium]|nr:hypothetical protein [Deltaproteobacteria bacterium]